MISSSKHLARPIALLTLATLATGADAALAQAPSPPRNVSVYSGTPTVPNATVTVAPATATVQPGGVVQFTATVTGTTNTAVVWSATGGSISTTGAYTAGTTQGTFRVTATISGGTISGSATVTIQATSSPNADIAVSPGQSIQNAVNSVPEGAVILVKAGVHRLTSPVTPRNRQTLVGEAGAILSGARVLTNWIADGSDWKVTGQTQQGVVSGSCISGFRCSPPEELFRDNQRLMHVASRAELGPGRWYFDYGADTIYVRDNPVGRMMETSVTTYAVIGQASGVIIRDLIVEKFANGPQSGAVGGQAPGEGWTITKNIVRLNHGGGVEVGTRMRVLDNKVVHNGQLGIHSGGVAAVDALVEGNEIGFNNLAGFHPGWEAGGTKFVHTDGLIVRNNWVHHNAGPGLWTDIDNIDTLYEGNLVEDNYAPAGANASAAGIFHEISYSAIIRNNTVRRNGTGFDAWGFGAGILIAASGGSGIDIYGNTVENNKDGIVLIQQNRGSGKFGTYLVQNVRVHDNTVRMAEGFTGAVQDIGDNAIFTSRNNRFENNTYYLGSALRYFTWMNADRTESEWRSLGQDTTGTFIR